MSLAVRNPLAAALLAAAAVLAAPASAAAPAPAAPTTVVARSPDSTPQPPAEAIDLLTLILQGGWLMAPIGLLSLLVVAFALERWWGLRRARVLPKGLIAELEWLGQPGADFHPRRLRRVCDQHPSAAANLVRAMLRHSRGPAGEVERAVAEASQREAARLYANVRWLNLAAAVAPLLGLLGTVWGMIRAFHDATHLAPGLNRADYLAEGIYIALVTTLAGLAVAIPAAVCAHWFEGRIESLLQQIEELLLQLRPQLDRYRRRARPAAAGRGKQAAKPARRRSEPRAGGQQKRAPQADSARKPK